MFVKSKGIIAVLAGVMSLCLLSACAADEKGADKESQQETASAEHGFHSESLPSKTDDTEMPPSGENMPSKETMPSEIKEECKAILLGESGFIHKDKMGGRLIYIENIRAAISSDEQLPARVTKFTILDLNGDGQDEIVLWIAAGDNLYAGFEVLFYRVLTIYGVSVPYSEFNGLKTDGTFSYSNSAANSGVGRLQLSKDGYTVEKVSDDVSQSSKTDVEWYDLTPENVELALPSEEESEEDIPSGMEEKYKAVLLKNADIIQTNSSKDRKRKITIENIWAALTSNEERQGRVTKFTILDLDGDGQDEIVLWIALDDNLYAGFEVLFYRDQEVYGVALWYRAFMNLKTDGTFEGSGGAGHGSVGRLQLSKDGYTKVEVSDDIHQSSKTDVEWYDFTPESVELAFENRF